jgi:nitroreductase
MAIVLWIGLVITAQAFQATPNQHAPAVVMSLLPGVAAWDTPDLFRMLFSREMIMDAMEALKTRRSVRSYKPDPIPREVVEEIVDCGRLAATAINIQPWEFVVVTDLSMRQNMAAATDHGPFIAQAPVCIAVFCRETKYFLEDGSAATQNLLVAAKALGLASCWVAGDKKPYADTIRKMLGPPAGYKLISLVTVGLPAEIPAPAKRPLKQVLHWEHF